MRFFTRVILSLLLLTSLSSLKASAPFAEGIEPDDQKVITGISYTIAITTYVGMTAAVAGTVYMTSMIFKDDDEAQAYLQEHQLDVVQGIATGEGPFVEMMSTALSVSDEERPAFTQGLTARYDELAELANAHTLTPERAHRFFELVFQVRAQL